MKIRNYMKKSDISDTIRKIPGYCVQIAEFVFLRRRTFITILAVLVALPILFEIVHSKNIGDFASINSHNISLTEIPIAATASQRGVINIPTGIVKANPFVPYRDISGTSVVNDVPAYTLVEPPETINENSDAARVMDTIVSGILYDKFSPSAILNIEGNDYLVKKGDIVNNYKVLNISQDSVTVKLGSNVYKAGIGEILTEGTLNYNSVSNLNNKFGGVK